MYSIEHDKKLMYRNSNYTFMLLFFASTICPQKIAISFVEGMQNNKKYSSVKASRHSAWTLVHRLYDRYVNTLGSKNKIEIPKKIHQIWVGPLPFPEKSKQLRDTWLELHPDWEYKLWRNEDIEQLNLINKDLYEKSTNWGQKSDIARYEILYRFGGLYVDTDFECLRPFDVFVNCKFFVGVSYDAPPRFSLFSGLIGSIAGHPILKEAIDSMTFDTQYKLNSAHYIMDTTGPYHLTRCFLKHALYCKKCIAFPVGYFYPWPNGKKHETERKKILQWVNPETFAIHHWHMSWAKQSKKKDPI